MALFTACANKCPPSSISNVTNDKNELRLKTVRLKTFQNAQ